MLAVAHQQYNAGRYKDGLATCETIYQIDAYRTDNLLLLGAAHFQLRNFSECIFYNQQCIRINPGFAEAYSNLGNALKELGDINAAIQFYLKVGVQARPPRAGPRPTHAHTPPQADAHNSRLLATD